VPPRCLGWGAGGPHHPPAHNQLHAINFDRTVAHVHGRDINVSTGAGGYDWGGEYVSIDLANLYMKGDRDTGQATNRASALCGVVMRVSTVP